jgi:LmbE family N-acetylglucosaminyl deacetylase
VPEDAAAPRTGPALAIFAHPDDAEISAGGTLAKWAAAGREVHLLVLTNGDRGSEDPAMDRWELARIRARETREAGDVMGLTSALVLDTHDGDLENTAEIRERVVRRIRETGAGTVVSCDPTAWFFEDRYYNHTDHRTAGAIALDASFPGAGNPHFFAEHLGEGLKICKVTDLWLGWTKEPNRTEDVSAFFDTKVAALAKHDSQLTEGVQFFDGFMREEAKVAGTKIGADLAEEFRILDLS